MMQFALLGDGPPARAMARAVMAHPDHRLVRQARVDAAGGDLEPVRRLPSPLAGEGPGVRGSDLSTRLAGVRTSRNWADLLADAEVDAIIVGGNSDELHAPDLQSIVRQLVQSGKPILVAPELVQSAAFFYELALVESESPGRIYPMLALRGHPLVEKLQELISRDELGNIRHVQFDRKMASAAGEGRPGAMSRSDLAGALLTDADLLRCLCGSYDQVTALRSGEAATGFSLATVTLAGSGAPQAVWTATAHASDSWQLTVSGDAKTAVLEGDPQTGRLRLTLREGDLAPVVEDVTDDGGDWILETFVASLAGQFALGQLASPDHDSAQPVAQAESFLWGELARAIEIVDAVERSVRRRRTIDVYFETPSERGIFKTQMTAVGCSLLMLTLAAVIFYLVLAAMIDMPPLLKRSMVVLIFLPLGAFLALQLLVFVARPATRDGR